MKKTPDIEGMTLVEVLVALAIFTVVSVAVLGLFPQVFRVNGQTRSDQAVTVAAKRFMEQTRVRYATRTGFDAGTLPNVPASTDAAGYTCTSTSNPQPDTALPSGEVRRVTLECEKTAEPTMTFALDFGRPAP